MQEVPLRLLSLASAHLSVLSIFHTGIDAGRVHFYPPPVPYPNCESSLCRIQAEMVT